MKRMVLVLTALAAVTPAAALDRNKPACTATEVAPGVKMRTGGCPMMFVPVEHDPGRAPLARGSDAPGPWSRPSEPGPVPVLQVRPSETPARP